MDSDGELVRRAVSGNSGAYGVLAQRWSSRVLAMCRAKVGCTHTAEDLAQESLLRGLRSLENLDSPEKFGAWIRGIAHRVCLDWFKSKQKSQVPFSVLTKNSPGEIRSKSVDASESCQMKDEIDQMMHYVDSLPEEFREVIMLYYYDDITYAELAELLGVSFATVNARLTKARRMLRQRLQGTSLGVAQQ